MIDHRFSLTQHTEHKHLYHLRFSVVLPPERYYANEDSSLVLEECHKQYPELVFDSQGCYKARLPDRQYVICTQCKVKDSYLEELVFSLPLKLDTIMAAICGFKKTIPPIEYICEPFQLVDLTPEDFYEELENLYAARHKLSLRIRAVTWKFLEVDYDNPIYLVQPTDYDFI